MRGEPGWEIVPEVAPIDGELIVDKPGKGAFYATDLDLLLRSRGITHIYLDRDHDRRLRAHDDARGERSRLSSACFCRDCTGATDVGNYEAALKMVTMQGGVFGAVASSEALLAAIGSREPALQA